MIKSTGVGWERLVQYLQEREARVYGAEGKALSAGREQEETTAKQAGPTSVEYLFMAIPPGLNIQTSFMRAGVS